MCSYCGCEAQPQLKALIQEHEKISALAREVLGTLDSQDHAALPPNLAELIRTFKSHARIEEEGLFNELVSGGMGLGEVEQLTNEHRDILNGLSDPNVCDHPQSLSFLIATLLRHAEMEETDLFPFAWQTLPGESWNKISSANK